MKNGFIVSTIFGAAVIAMCSIVAHAAPDGVKNRADTIHPNIHRKVGQGDGTNANPGVGNANGNQIHGIRNNRGISGNGRGEGSFVDELGNVHGGIGAVNPNVPD